MQKKVTEFESKSHDSNESRDWIAHASNDRRVSSHIFF